MVPANAIDGTLFRGARVDVHLENGIGERELTESRARFYKAKPRDGRVVLVLGAGNVSGIPTKDALSKIFNEGKACVLKMNPVNAYLGPFLERAFAEAIRKGYLAVVYGGVEEGAYLAGHAGVDEVHLTGSEATYNNIVWGPPGPVRSFIQRCLSKGFL